MDQFGKGLVVLGIVLVVVGALLWSGVGRGWLGRLPGDIHYTRDGFSFHFPLITCLLVSLIISFLMWIFRK